ncbi:MAG: sodium/proline symporter PutP [Bacillota bacterium]|uniref:Sodium/proline symporter n=1 Tax=Virgibacillus salarius TaxID=447199 RepID=A0A941DRR4_9BACI|nr:MULTISPECIES: sodium/proline symporter PutP [Bacillaceae]NAZ08576.1 sodium/proline symporter PutP [Agaribacter marinus]MBR7795864.1 sodium/proline symporter PutP [Virgibacillus salarius]MCC2250736.1 sodium/proline symporter PutP [Virgibacillus sp. AGTR]MDY7042817.1 sodium/proline symporter PutP [Virgibacillus sp. M23]QRZ18086.1 sodium/proline symporter PutP [Virgibacillus sp. AGTR]
MNPTILTFIVYLIVMILIGIVTYRMTNTLSDYVLGGRKLNSWVTAFSASASDFSGWLLIGLPGAAYAAGLGTWSLWIAVGLAIGAMINWQYVAKRLRIYTEYTNDSITLPQYFENRFRDNSHLLRVISAVFILAFFLFYTASGLVAGAKLFQGTFEMDYHLALTVGAIIIVAYTFLGGFLAVSYTDFIQGALMSAALLFTSIYGLIKIGGFGELFNQLGHITPSLIDAFAATDYSQAEGILWESAGAIGAVGIISALAWGLGYFGQPHILARFMAIRSHKEVRKARLISVTMGLVIPLYGALIVGMLGIITFDQPLADSEQVFIQLVQVVYNPWVAGILLAAVLAAIMSTVDSQLLVSSSALSEDFYRRYLRKNASENELVWVGRISVLVIALIAVLIAWNETSSVLNLVGYAWAGFGATFGPAILFSLFWRKTSRNGAIAGILVGGITVFLWPLTGSELYEMVPGFILSSIAIIGCSLVGKGPSNEMLKEYDKVTGVK